MNGANCTADIHCLYGAQTTTSYVYCNLVTKACECRSGFTWDTATLACKCLANKNVTGTGALAQCRKFWGLFFK